MTSPLAAEPNSDNAARLAAIVDSIDDAIFFQDSAGRITDWNPGAERMFGYSAAEIIGQSIATLIPPGHEREVAAIEDRRRRGERVAPLETQRRRKDGQIIDVVITEAPIRDATGKTIGAARIARDVSGQLEHERELARFTRLYAALSQVNQAIVWTSDRDELLSRVCQVLVDFGGFRGAWIGVPTPSDPGLVPAGCDASGVFSPDDLRLLAEPNGTAATAVRLGQEQIVALPTPMTDSPSTSPPPAPGLTRCRSLGSFPIKFKEEVWGALSVYSDDPGFFQDKEIALLTEVAADVAFALERFTEREARERVEQMAESERQFSANMIESMPGVVYFYDESGHFLRWNKNFETVTGYSETEIATMTPLDFFGDDEQASVAERIADVFSSGESFIEANFRSKDGTLTPYFFTGRRVEFAGKRCLVGMGVDVSERVRAEDLSRTSETRYRTLFEHAPDGLLIGDANGYYLDANPSICRMLGYTRAQLVGLHAKDIIDPTQHDRIDRVINEIKASVDHHHTWNFRRRDGSIFPVEVIATQLPEGQMLGMVRDITERQRAEAAIRDAETRFHTLFTEAPIGVIIIDPANSSFVDFNEQAARQLEYSPAEFSRLSVDDIEAAQTHDQTRQRTAKILRTGRDVFETRHRTQSGQIREVLITVRAISLGGRTMLQCAVLDITERKLAERALNDHNETLEREVADRTRDLQSALTRAEAADRLKSAFLATMSHELRTPLNSIIGFTSIIAKGLAGPVTPEQIRQLGMVLGSSRHLLALINDVLDLSKIEAGQLDVRTAPFPVHSALERVVALVQPLADAKNLVIKLEIASEPGDLTNDRRRFEQILLNLANNAIKFTEHGGVTITAERITRQKKNEPTALPHGALRVCVTDTGIGIEPHDLEEIFQPFRQIDSGINRLHEGTGLGLAICRRLAGLLGGTITVSSTRSIGSTFSVTFPDLPPAEP